MSVLLVKASIETRNARSADVIGVRWSEEFCPVVTINAIILQGAKH